jgi:hypothetical protein
LPDLGHTSKMTAIMHFSLGLGVWRYSLLFDFVASWPTTRLISRSPTG